jgi:formylmethanofuran dehydrogenase subunit B
MMNLTSESAQVFFPTGSYGVDAAGTCYRMDNVPIRLREVIAPMRPTDEAILGQIIEEIKRC